MKIENIDQTAVVKLKQMFPDLKRAYVCQATSTPSWNDGGNTIRFMWKLSDRYLVTEYNDWCVDHPDTTCHRVIRSWERRERLLRTKECERAS